MQSPWIPAEVRDLESEGPDKLKLQFARLIADAPNDPNEHYKALRRLFPLPSQESMCQDLAAPYSPRAWINDPLVMGEIARLKRERDDNTLPDKASIARQLLNMAENERLSVDARLKAYKQYCELMNLLPDKSAPNPFGQGNTFVDNRRVLMVPAQSDNMDDWQKRAREIRQKQIEGVARDDNDA